MAKKLFIKGLLVKLGQMQNFLVLQLLVMRGSHPQIQTQKTLWKRK